MRAFPKRLPFILVWLFSVPFALAEESENNRQAFPMQIETFDQQTHRAYSKADGLPGEVLQVACDSVGTVNQPIGISQLNQVRHITRRSHENS